MQKFVGEEIKVTLENGNFLEKKPKCPISFIWGGKEIRIIALLESWTDFSRKGLSSRNMREEHLQRAQVKGSWGVGRYYFRIADEIGTVYTIYYDRAPTSSKKRKGNWILFTIE